MNGDLQTLDQLIRKSAQELAALDIERPLYEARLIMEFACDIKITEQLSQANLALTERQRSVYTDFIKRRKQGIPIAYLENKAYFYGREFFVEDCLIPRPETELIIDLVLEYAEDWFFESCHILDICTGSGCLGLTSYLELDKHFETSAILTDISKLALKTCAKNIAQHKSSSRVKALYADLFPDKEVLRKMSTKLRLEKQANKKNQNTFDLILANPPYIKSFEIAHLQKEVVLCEPHLALDGGKDGLDFYKRIAKEIKPFLAKDRNTILLLEHGLGQGSEIIEIFLKSNLNILNIIEKKDLQGHDRMLALTFVKNA